MQTYQDHKTMMNTVTKNTRIFAARALMTFVLLMAPVVMIWAQEMNEKYSLTTQMFLNELREEAGQPAAGPRHVPPRRLPDGRLLPQPRRLIASPDTVAGVAYISCFIHLKDVGDLGSVRALGVEIEETFDGLDFVTARVPVNQLEPLANIDNVTKIKVAQQMRPLTDVARQQTNVDDLLTQSPDATALGITSKYDGTGVILGVIDLGIDFQHIAFRDKNGNSRIKRAYVYNGSSAQEYTSITSTSPTTDDNSEDHGTHTATTAGGSSVIVNGSTVTVTDDHASATYGGMAPGADLYLAGIKGLSDTYLTNALKKMVTYADSQGKPLVVSNSWGSSWGPRTGTGEWADLVGTYFGDTHPNRVILFAASNDAGHKNGNEGGGYFVKKSSASDGSPLGTIIRTDGYGGDIYLGLIACAWNASNSTMLNCKLHVLNSSGTILKSWPVDTNGTSSFSGLSTYYSGSMTVYIEKENGKYRLALYSADGIQTKSSGAYTLAIEVYPESGSANINMWSGDWSFFTDNYTTSGHTWLDGTDDMCVSDEATIPNAISVGAYVSKKTWKASNGSTYTSNAYTVGDIAYFSSYATADQSPTGLAYPWITAPGARLAAGVNHYHTASVDDYSYYGDDYKTDLVVNNSKYPYAMMEGTSMATPVAAGIVALWLQASLDENAAHKNLTVNDVKTIMEATAINDNYTTTGANASHFGKGKIDALAGIQYILGSSSSPLIKATPTSIDFADKNPYATRSYTKTLNVKGFNLEGAISVTLADANGVYSLSQTSITQSAAADGVDITITYAPQAAGTHNATITLTSSNATSVEVPVTATAQAATPTLIADPETLTFTAGLNEQKSLTFDVLSEFLTGNVSVTLSDVNNVFSIDKTSITKADSEEGATVTVTFQSATAGTFNGTVTLSSAGAEDVVISLTGTAATISDETIDFTAQGFANATAVTSVSGTNCTVTFDKGTNSSSPTYYSTGSAIRAYGGNTMTIASTTKNIVKIELTFGSSDGSNTITTDVESYSNGTWTGSASSVTFTVGGTSGNRRIQKVKVTYAESGGGTTPVDPTLAYYQNADGTMGSALKTSMCGIIYNRTQQSYDDLWEAFKTTDVKSNGKIWDMYSNITNYTPVTSGSSYSQEGDCYNREHSWPQSWFNSNAPMYTDLHHIYPTDGFVNGKRSNYPFGETSNPTYTSANDFSKLGTCTYPGYTGIVFEPADEYKGDFARTYFYMVTCYEEKLADWYTNYSSTDVVHVINGTTYPAFQTWQLNMLMKWAKNDPVSEKEIARNNAVYAIQNNRNPFIDYPGLEEYIWGSMTTTAFSYDNYVQPVYNQEPPTTPTGLALSDVTSTSINASWTAVADATSYDIDVVQGSSFEASAGESVLQADFSSTTGWTLSGTGTYTGAGYYGDASPSIKFDGTGDYAISPEFSSGVKLQFWAYGNGGSGSTFKISGLVNNAWTDIETVTIAQGGATCEVNLPDGTTQVRFDFTKSVNCALDDVIIYGPSNNPVSLDGYPKSVANVTSYDVTGLTPNTQYAVRVRAVNDAGNSDWSAAATTTTIANSAPVLTVPQTSYAVTVGDPDVNFTVTVTGTPEPTVIATCTEGAYFVFEDNEFLFETSVVGTYHFVFTATNSEGSDSKTVTIVVSPAPVTVPELTVSDVTSNSAVASWTECNGVTEYTLQLASDDEFTESSSGNEPTTLINESFEDNKIPTGWTSSGSNISIANGKSGDGTYCVAFKGTDAYLITPLVENPANVSFNYKRSSNTAAWGLDVSYATSKNGPWTKIDEVSGASTSWQTFSQELDDVGSVYIKFTDTRSSGTAERYIDLVQITSAGSDPVAGSIISTQTVNGTDYTFTGLTPETTYYARVKGDADWSNVVSFTTNAVLSLADEGNNSSAISTAASSGKKYDVTLSGRTLWKDGGWNTLCLPFTVDDLSVTELAGATLMELDIAGNYDGNTTGLNGSTLYLYFKNATSIEAGVPYIIRWDSSDNIVNPTFTGVTINNASLTDKTAAFTGGKFIGSYIYQSFTTENKYILLMGDNNTLYYPQPDLSNPANPIYPYLGAFRAYFELESSIGNAVLYFGDETTGMMSLTPDPSPRGEGSGWYTLQGLKLGDNKPTTPGVYIHNGRKIIVK